MNKYEAKIYENDINHESIKTVKQLYHIIVKSFEFTKENDRNSTKIVFRCPDLNRRIERRFLKTDTVDILYNFVDSLGKEIFSESEAYELVQTFPFKSYTNKQRTLGEEGLFPNAIIQIREI